MINKMLSSTGRRSSTELYIDKTDDNYGIGEGLTFHADATDNIAIGENALNSTNTDAIANIGIGTNALTAITGGDYNIAVGSGAGASLTTSGQNIAIGLNALTQATTNSNDNIAIGTQSMDGAWGTTDVDNCVFVGGQTGSAQFTSTDITGTVGIGYNALNALASGGGNTAIGYNAGVLVSDGTHNTIIGSLAGDGFDSEDDNTFIGYNCGGGNINGANNCVAIGSNTLAEAATQDGTVAIGAAALAALTSGANNIAVGYASGEALMEGSRNTSLGYQTLADEEEGSMNTAIGYLSLYVQNAGGTDDSALDTFNTAVGAQAGTFVSTGKNNTFIGATAGNGITGTRLTGDNNTAVGKAAGFELEGAAHSNTFVGALAGNTTETGTGNTIIGYNCETDNDTRVGSVVIGNSHNLQTASDNVFEVGNASNYIKYDLDSGDITITSDRRVKKDIVDTDLGLDFVNKLKPVKYKFRPNKDYAEEFGIDKEFIVESLPEEKAEIVHDGLIAQDVKEVMDEMGISFSGWEEDGVGRQRLGYINFITPLIKAIQELSAEVEKLKNK